MDASQDLYLAVLLKCGEKDEAPCPSAVLTRTVRSGLHNMVKQTTSAKHILIFRYCKIKMFCRNALLQFAQFPVRFKISTNINTYTKVAPLN